MAKKKQVTAVVKLQATGGQATPAPPVGTALGPHGVNIGQSSNSSMKRHATRWGRPSPSLSRSTAIGHSSFVLKSPPASVLLKQAAQVAKGSASAKLQKVGVVTSKQVTEIARRKFDDLNAPNLEHAARIIAGTARSVGIEIVD